MTLLPLVSAEEAVQPVSPFQILPDQPAHQIAVEELHALVFGPGRFTRTAYRVRGKGGHERSLSFTALFDGRIIGSVWQTFVHIGSAPAILLGPLAVHPDFAGRGYGQALMAAAIAAARLTAASAIVLVGDAPYYARAGFTSVPHQRIGWPGPVDPARVLGLALEEGAVERLSGPIRSGRLPLAE